MEQKRTPTPARDVAFFRGGGGKEISQTQQTEDRKEKGSEAGYIEKQHMSEKYLTADRLET